MVISLSVLLVCSLAADRLTSEILPQERTCIPNTATIDMPFGGPGEFDGAVTLNAGIQNIYAASANIVCAHNGMSIIASD